MTLERRDGRTYYYRSARVGDKVRKEYVGAGYVAELAAELDRTKRETAEAERARWRHELERLRSLSAPVLELDQVAEVLVRAHLLSGGYRRYKGEWRMRRDA